MRKMLEWMELANGLWTIIFQFKLKMEKMMEGEKGDVIFIIIHIKFASTLGRETLRQLGKRTRETRKTDPLANKRAGKKWIGS